MFQIQKMQLVATSNSWTYISTKSIKKNGLKKYCFSEQGPGYTADTLLLRLYEHKHDLPCLAYDW